MCKRFECCGQSFYHRLASMVAGKHAAWHEKNGIPIP